MDYVVAALVGERGKGSVREMEAVGDVNCGWAGTDEGSNDGDYGVIGEAAVVAGEVEGLEECG